MRHFALDADRGAHLLDDGPDTGPHGIDEIPHDPSPVLVLSFLDVYFHFCIETPFWNSSTSESEIPHQSRRAGRNGAHSAELRDEGPAR
jgi:hypothetical protein